jgi:hypothetical protein
MPDSEDSRSAQVRSKNTLDTYVQETQWQQQTGQQMAQMNALLQQQDEQRMPYWQSLGYNPRP